MSFFLRKRLALAVLGVISGPVSAAVFEVTTFADAVDASVGNTCLTSTGACSLRAAIQEANFQSGGPHTIKLPAGTYNLTLQGAQGQMEDGSMSGDLDINASMNIEGFGADKTTIVVLNPPANTDYRVFHIGTSSAASVPNVTIKGVTIKGGQSTQGAGIYLQSGSLELLDSQIDANNVNISNSVGGAGIFSNGNLKIKNSTIANNVVSNNSNAFGGGIYIGQNSTGTQITGSTIYNNTTSGTQGGGIYNLSQNQSSPLVIASSTIYRNTVVQGGAGAGLFGVTGASMQMRNSVLAGNQAGGVNVNDCGGVITSSGNNLVGLAPFGSPCTFNASTSVSSPDIVGSSSGDVKNPNLGIYQLNSGTTFTVMPTGSPLTDAGNQTGCLAADGLALTTDQRGFARAVVSTGTAGIAGRCDIGATELNSINSAPVGGSATGPSAIALAFTAYGPTGAAGSLAGINPDTLKTDSTSAPSALSCNGGSATTVTGLVYCIDSSVQPRGSVSINPASGYFVYTLLAGGTGVDSFKYTVQNGSGAKATGEVSITLSNNPISSTTPLTFPAGGITLSVKPGNKIRASIPFVDTTPQSYSFDVNKGGRLAQKGTVNVSMLSSTVYLEYIPTDGQSGTDVFDLNVSNGASSVVFPITVNIGAGSSSSLAASGAFIKDDISRSSSSIGDLKAALRFPSNAAITFPTTNITLSPNVGSIVVNADGNFTYTAPTSGTTEGRVTFKITPMYDSNFCVPGSSCTPNRVSFAEMTATLNFVAGSVPVPNTVQSTQISRAIGSIYTGTLTTGFSIPSGATNVSYEVSVLASGNYASSAMGSYGKVDVNANTGSFTYTVTGQLPTGTNSETLYYRVRYTDSTSTSVTSTSGSIVAIFVGSVLAPVANNMPVTVPRTLATTAISPLVSNPVSGQVFELLLNGALAQSITGAYGTISPTSSGFSYAVGSMPTASGVLTEVFQYRVRYTDSGSATAYTAAATLTITLGQLPVAHGHALPGYTGQDTPITLSGMSGSGAKLTTGFVITTLPISGDLYTELNGTTKIVLPSAGTGYPLTSDKVYYRSRVTVTTDSFVFKVRENSLDSAVDTMTISFSGNGGGAGSLDEGGGGSLNPLALLALLALYARRRLH